MSDTRMSYIPTPGCQTCRDPGVVHTSATKANIFIYRNKERERLYLNIGCANHRLNIHVTAT